MILSNSTCDDHNNLGHQCIMTSTRVCVFRCTRRENTEKPDAMFWTKLLHRRVALEPGTEALD